MAFEAAFQGAQTGKGPATPKMVKGYSLRAGLEFMERELDPSARQRVLARLPPALQTLLPTIENDRWYQRPDMIVLLRAIAAEYSTDRQIYDAMVRLGMLMARAATNVFLRLVIRILTPSIFAKKLPQLFVLDNRGEGYVKVDSSGLKSRRLVMMWEEMLDYDYFQPICEGWIRFFFDAMGKSDLEVTTDYWTHEIPSPSHFRIEIRWT